jgi:putative flippase GtrA
VKQKGGMQMKKIKQFLTAENIKQFLIYLIVGALATIVEWCVFYALDGLGIMHYLLAVTIAYVISTFANWFFGKLLLFHEKQNIWRELGKIYATSVIGLLLNWLIMWFLVDCLAMFGLSGISEMAAKIIATAVVFFWNFIIRKFVIYKI